MFICSHPLLSLLSLASLALAPTPALTPDLALALASASIQGLTPTSALTSAPGFTSLSTDWNTSGNTPASAPSPFIESYTSGSTPAYSSTHSSPL